jgi:hypothetical protein
MVLNVSITRICHQTQVQYIPVLYSEQFIHADAVSHFIVIHSDSVKPN